MSEILNYYKKRKIEAKLLTDKYFDVVLARDEGIYTPFSIKSGLSTDCLSTYIDMTNENCITSDGVVSLSEYTYENAKLLEEDTVLKDFNFVGLDNGRILFDKYTVSGKEFLNIIFPTSDEIVMPAYDASLHLYKVSGNTQTLDYSCEYNENDECYSFKGGFLQGFFKLYGFNYEILPPSIESEWNLEFVIRPKSYKTKENILNNEHPKNKGIFFYMGTRAENKFAQFYNSEQLEKYKDETIGNVFCDDFANKPYSPIKPSSQERQDSIYIPHLQESFNNPCNCECIKNNKENDAVVASGNCDYYFADDYLAAPTVIDESSLKTSDGKPFTANGYYEIKTDNKHLFFNRTKDGFTTNTWIDADVILTGITREYKENLFLAMHHGKNGKTTNLVYDLDTDYTVPYNFEKDIKNNSFALKYNDDGSISYRYLIKDCNSEQGFSIQEETTFSGIITSDEWNIVNVKLSVLNPTETNDCGIVSQGQKMKLRIYVNGYLKFVSKELPALSFSELNDTFDKQEGVPYNISLGGGTQGLRETIGLHYWERFPYILPIEQNFAGSFIGDIKSFKFYTCKKEYNAIKNNALFEMNKEKEI